ncbi:MAG: hypothetical protein IPI67_23105 [Myxococcales bacterium]|nr:hypothetical protein [Myxococcales bacterium]
MTERARARISLSRLVELFATFNLGFLALDVWLAHEANGFANGDEWAPVVFSATAPLLLVPGVLTGSHGTVTRLLGLIVGFGAIVVGVAGMVFHLESAFFQRETLSELVYSAPFVAPLSYVGVGLLLVLGRLEREESEAWGLWVVFLAFAGFSGNFALTLLDHAQNGFFTRTEWIGVVAAAYGAGALLPVVLGERDRPYLKLTVVIMGTEALVGAFGAYLHLARDLAAPGVTLHDRLVYGAPVFAPLLFADLALLAVLGLWHRFPLTRGGPQQLVGLAKLGR